MTFVGRSLSVISLALLSFASQLFAQSQQLQVAVSRGAMTGISVYVPYNFTYSTNKQASQGRIVVDITCTKNCGDVNEALRSIPVGTRLVKEVLIGAFKPGTSRVVVVLAEKSTQAPFTVSRLTRSRGVQVQIGGSAPPASALPAKDAPTPSKSATAEPALTTEPKSQAASQPAAPLSSPQTEKKPDPTQLVPPLRAFQLPARIGIVKEVPLTLSEALSLAMANNPDFQAARVDGEEAGFKVIGASGVYVPNFNWLGSFDRQTIPISSSLGGSNSGSVLNRSWQTLPSVAGLSPRFGGNYEVAFSIQRYSSNNLFATLNPNYPTLLSLRYSQPLWRNLHYDSNRHAIEVARKNRQMTAETLRLRVAGIVYETEQAYWELTYARSDLEIQLRALEIARQQDESNRRQLDRGLPVPIETVASQTQATNFEIAVYAAQEALTRAENTLKNLILGDRSAALWDAALNPTSAPEIDFAMPDLADVVKDALAQRPESARLRIVNDINQANQRLKREQLKPQLDLIASYSQAGLAGRQVFSSGTNPITDSLTPALERLNQLSLLAGLGPVGTTSSGLSPGTLLGSYGRSLNDLFSGDFPSTEIQLRFSLPLSNRTARANLEESLAEGRRLGFEKKAVEQAVESEIRNALQGIDSARQRLQAARVRSQTAGEQFQSEQRRFERGDSTLFLVQQRQLTMVTSTSQVNRAEADLSEAISLLELARGANYKRRNIVVK